MTTETHPKPWKPAIGQRWRYDGRTRSQTFEVEARHSTGRVVLRGVRADGTVAGEKRLVEFERLLKAYEYLGDFAVPEGYSVHKVGNALGGHCFRSPAGYVESGTQEKPWSWKDARDAANEHAKARSSAA